MHPEAFAADIDRTAADGAKVWMERIIDYADTHSGMIKIACAGDELIGMSGIVRGHWPKTMHSGKLWGVYVKLDWRGNKIGAALINGCVEWAIENNLVVVTLGVTNSNQAAIQFYVHCGFEDYGIEPKAIHYNNEYYDDMLMFMMI